MKQKKIKNYLKLGFLFFGISILLWNCEREESSEIRQENFALKVMRFSELPSNLSKNIDDLGSILKNSRTETDNFLIVDESQIIALVDSLDNTRYSVKISFNNQPENILYNLVLGTDSFNQEIDPFVLKYTITNLEEIDQGTHLDFSRMSGSIADYSFDRFLLYAENYLSQSSNRNDNFDPCNEYEGSGGGEFVDPNADNNTNDDDNGGGCQVDIWSAGENGDIFAINWHCSDGSSGSFGRNPEDCTGGTDNQNGGGGTGVNQGDQTNTCTGGKIDDGNGNCVCPSGYVEDSNGICVNPCDDIRNHLNETAVSDKMQILGNSLNMSAETGFIQGADGGLDPMEISNNGHSLRFGNIAGSLGYMHTHTKPYQDANGRWQRPVNIFSPKDVIAFLTLLKSATLGGHNLSDIYATIVSPNGTYTLRFSGNISDIPTLGIYNNLILSEAFKDQMEGITRAEPTEQVFLKFLKQRFNINGINLYRVNSNGSTSLKTLDSSGEISSNPC